MIDICEVLQEARDNGASDLYLKAGIGPRVRINGKISELSYRIVTADDMLECLLKITTAEQRSCLEECGECCFSYDENADSRYRVNVFKSRNVVSMVFHMVWSVRSVSRQFSGQQEQIRELAAKEKGLVLFAGNAGSGRTGSMAAVVHGMNQNNPVHIMTLESPIEVLQTSDLAIVSQRELGTDYADAVTAVESALKETVDVLVYDGKLDEKLVSELCRASGLGMLVLASTYGETLSEIVANITALFKADEKNEVRRRLAEVLQAVVICQRTEEAEGQQQKWEMISVDDRIKNQIQNGI